MMIGNRGKIKLSALILASVMSINFAIADSYKNNVVDVKVNKESTNAVKVTIYTDKPYTEPVVVNKKANNKYVILMPETKSTLKNSPSVSNAYGTISDVSVNTQEGGSGKGYTKITITSQKAITVVPQTQLFVKSKNPQTAVKPATKQNASASGTTKPKTTVSTNKSTASSVAAKNVTSQKNAVQNTKTASNQKNKTTSQTKSVTTVPAKKVTPVQNTVATKPLKTATPVSKPTTNTANSVTKSVQQKKQPIEILEQEVKNNTSATNVVADKTDKVLNDEIKDNISKQQQDDLKNGKNKKKSDVYESNSKDKTTVDNLKTVKKSYSGVSFWKILLLLAAILFPLLVIMAILGMDKKINKKIDESFRSGQNDTYTDEIPSENHVSEEIPPVVPVVYNEPDEENDAVVDTSPVQEETAEQTFNSFDEMLDNVESEQQSYHEEYLQQNNPELAVSTDEDSDLFENDFDDSDFEHEVEDNQDVVPTVVDTSNEDEVAEAYDDVNLADFSEVNDGDFFDELAMQTMAATNAEEGLPDQLPADEIFDFMTESEDVSDENAIVSDAPNQETIKYDNDLTMLTEVKLNDNSGLYLVNYENFSSLVGHIKEDYFVIKKFDDIVSDKIYLKETEKLKDSTRYLVRVGKNKMVVEVSDTSMSRLLDL